MHIVLDWLRYQNLASFAILKIDFRPIVHIRKRQSEKARERERESQRKTRRKGKKFMH